MTSTRSQDIGPNISDIIASITYFWRMKKSQRMTNSVSKVKRPRHHSHSFGNCKLTCSATQSSQALDAVRLGFYSTHEQWASRKMPRDAANHRLRWAMHRRAIVWRLLQVRRNCWHFTTCVTIPFSIALSASCEWLEISLKAKIPLLRFAVDLSNNEP